MLLFLNFFCCDLKYTIEEATEECLLAFLNDPQIGPLVENGCLDINDTVAHCALDLFNTNNEWFITMHIQLLIDSSIHNILTLQENCNTTDPTTLCPNNCNQNGVCVFGKPFFDLKKILNLSLYFIFFI